MSDVIACRVCPPLRVENGELHGQVEYLRDALGTVVGGVVGTVDLIDREDERPTMPRRQLLPAVHQMLTVIASAGGVR